MKRIVLATALFLTGCSIWYGQRPEWPHTDHTKLAVLPVTGKTPVNQEFRFGSILAEELVQFPGIEEVTRPEDAFKALLQKDLDIRSTKDLRQLAKELKVSGIVCPHLYKFKMIDSPIGDLRCDLVLAETGPGGADFALDMVRGGTLPNHSGGNVPGIISVEKVFDAETHEVSDNLFVFSMRNNADTAGLDRTNRVKRIGSNYFRFMSDQILRDLILKLKKRADNDRTKNS